MINLAHDMAKQEFGNTFPNPSVGCIISKNSKIISQAVTSKSGRPHAEEIAQEEARERELEQARLVATLQSRDKKRLTVLMGCILAALVVAVVMYFDSVEARSTAEASALENKQLALEASKSEQAALTSEKAAKESEAEAQRQTLLAEENATKADEQAKAAEEAAKAQEAAAAENNAE